MKSVINQSISQKPKLRLRKLDLLLVALFVLLPIVAILIWRPLLWAFGVANTYIGVMGWVVFVVLALWCVLEFSGRRASQPNAGGRSRKRRLSIAVLGTALVLGGNLSTNLAASRLDRHWNTRLPRVREVYTNHDVTKLVGESIGLMLLRLRDYVVADADRRALTTIANAAPRNWLAMTSRTPQDPRLVALTDQHVSQFVRDRSADALTREAWTELLGEWENATATTLSPECKNLIASRLPGLFSITFRETLKHDFTRGGKAWAAVQLDMHAQLARTAAHGSDAGDPVVAAAMARVARSLEGFGPLLSDVRRLQDEHAREVSREFVDVQATLGEIAEDVRYGRYAAETASENSRILVEIELVKADPSLSDDDKYERILELGSPNPRSPEDHPEPLDLSDDIRSFVDRMASNATLIDRHRTKVLLGDFVAADSLAVEYEVERAAQRAKEDYAFFVSRGERYWRASANDDAVEWFSRALEIQSDDWRILNLAGVTALRTRRSLSFGRDLFRADTWLDRALHIARTEHRGDHPDVALSLNNLAGVREALGRAKEAELLYEEGHAMNQRMYTGDHPAVARSLNNLASVQQTLGRAKDAEPLFEEALAMRKRLYAGDHPDVAQSLNNLAYVRKALGRANDAEPLYEEALAMRKRWYDGDHPDIAQSLNNLASTQQALGWAKDAEPLFEEALAMRRRLYVGDHPDVAGSLNNLAYVREALGRVQDAEPLYEEALAMNKRMYAGDHPFVALSINNLAGVRQALGWAKDAEPLYEEALAMLKRLYSGDHPDVAQGLNNLGYVRKELGQAENAEPLYEEALAIRKRLYPGDHPDVAQSLNNLAGVREALGGAQDAEPLYEEALAMRKRLYAGDHPRVALSLNNLAGLREALGRTKEAESLYEEALAMRKRLYSGGHPDVAQSLNSLAGVREILGRAEDAEPLYQEALEIASRLLPKDHPDLRVYRENLEKCRATIAR